MKYNHQYAEQLLQELDPKGKVYNEINKALPTVVMLPDFILIQGKKTANKELDNQDLRNELIVIAESIYKCLEKENFPQLEQYSSREPEQLFNLILDNLLHGLSEEQLVEVIGEIGVAYGVEI